MNRTEIKELVDKVYAISWSGFPLDSFLNDIRDSNNPNYDKNSAYQDMKLIVDEIYRLRELNKKPTLEEVKQEWEELGYRWEEHNGEIDLINKENEEVIVIDYENKQYTKTDTNVKFILYITFQEHNLLTRTFKALGWEDK